MQNYTKKFNELDKTKSIYHSKMTKSNVSLVCFLFIIFVCILGVAYNTPHINNNRVASAEGGVSTFEGWLEISHQDISPLNPSVVYEYQIRNANGSIQKINPTNPGELVPNNFVSISGTINNNVIEGSVHTISKTVNELTPDPDTSFPNGRPYDIAVFLIKPENNNNPVPFTQSEVNQIINFGPFAQFIQQSSYNKRYIDADVFDWIAVPNCATARLNTPVVSDFIIQNGIDLNLYKHVLFIKTCGDTYSYGSSSIGPSSILVNGVQYTHFSQGEIKTAPDILIPSAYAAQFPQPFVWTTFDALLAHEMGHGFGLDHSRGLKCDGGASTLGTDCSIIEYGNTFDAMGRGTGHSQHYNAAQKKRLGWLKPQIVTESGTYTVHRLETGSSTIKLIEISNPDLPASSVKYVVEHRRGIGYDGALNAYASLAQNQQGIFILRDDNAMDTRLLDTKTVPFNSDWFSATKDAALTGTDVFTDTERGITIGPIVSVNSSSITFNVSITPVTACTHNDPQVTVFTPYVYNPNFFANKVRNMDSVACENSVFEIKLVPQGPIGNTIVVNKTLAPQEFYADNYTYLLGPALPLGTPPGSYIFDLKVKNLTNPGNEIINTVVINVP